ncbi:MAG: hypothetical protein QHI38_13825, partial [Armatimonadota bacterium]|nr:hypothetical protein [Armatimonadota bacterium]
MADLVEAAFGVQAVGAEAGLPIVEAGGARPEAGVHHPLRPEAVVAVALLHHGGGVDDGRDRQVVMQDVEPFRAPVPFDEVIDVADAPHE